MTKKDENNWTISGDHQSQSVEDFLESTDDFDSSLGSIEGVDDALESWGMSVPGVIGEDEDIEVPGKIEGEDDDRLTQVEMKDQLSDELISEGTDEEIPAEIKMEDQLSNEFTSEAPAEDVFNSNETEEDDSFFPEDGDLEYPDLDAMSLDEAPSEAEEEYSPKSQLISLEDINQELDELASDNTNSDIHLTQEYSQEGLRKELNESMDPDEFWATDDFPTLSQKVEPSPPEDTVEEAPIEEPGKDDLQIKPSANFASIDISEFKEDEPTVGVKVDHDAIVADVKEALTPHLEKIVKELFSEKIEQIAWEVIPDLAENIIKDQVAEIAKQVYLSRDKKE